MLITELENFRVVWVTKRRALHGAEREFQFSRLHCWGDDVGMFIAGPEHPSYELLMMDVALYDARQDVNFDGNFVRARFCVHSWYTD